MDTKRALCGFLVVPLFAGVATAAGPLSDRQMDIVTGGDPPTFVCPEFLWEHGRFLGIHEHKRRHHEHHRHRR